MCARQLIYLMSHVSTYPLRSGSYAAAVGRGSTRSADWKLPLPIFVRVHPSRVSHPLPCSSGPESAGAPPPPPSPGYAYPPPAPPPQPAPPPAPPAPADRSLGANGSTVTEFPFGCVVGEVNHERVQRGRGMGSPALEATSTHPAARPVRCMHICLADPPLPTDIRAPAPISALQLPELSGGVQTTSSPRGRSAPAPTSAPPGARPPLPARMSTHPMHHLLLIIGPEQSAHPAQ